jgi:RHS repeat-associated protein
VHQFNNLPIAKNGYLFVYVSNETPNIDVYFDNLQVTHIRGPLLEENHYYPFGLTMGGISSIAILFGRPENKTKFQSQEFSSKEFSDGSGLETYEFKYRMDDPQIGRFWQVDPVSTKYVYNSTYAFSENHVTSHIELEGLEKFDINTDGDRQKEAYLQGKHLRTTRKETYTRPYSAAFTSADKNSSSDNLFGATVSVVGEVDRKVTETPWLKTTTTVYSGQETGEKGGLFNMNTEIDVTRPEDPKLTGVNFEIAGTVGISTDGVGFSIFGESNGGKLSVGTTQDGLTLGLEMSQPQGHYDGMKESVLPGSIPAKILVVAGKAAVMTAAMAVLPEAAALIKTGDLLRKVIPGPVMH